ncbi:MAG: pyrroline-5-carboxylate reductase dimerization domain-containing protein, partial [Bradyrhizobium sp.]
IVFLPLFFQLVTGATATTVGGTVAGAGNLISNNDGDGVHLLSDATADHVVIAGNLIGTDSSGKKALGNTMAGVFVGNTMVNTIGGTTAAALEVLMANDGLQPLMTRAIAAATRRSKELAK